MWEVIATKNGRRERCAVASKWSKAKDLARRALDMGWQVKIKTIFADIVVTNTNGEFLVVATKIRVQDATRFSAAWLRECRAHSTGCMLWPHGKPMPQAWSVIK
jgi:hypothetical protein